MSRTAASDGIKVLERQKGFVSVDKKSDGDALNDEADLQECMVALNRC